MNEEKEWTISIGFYPGVLFGFRSYESEDHNNTCTLCAVL